MAPHEPRSVLITGAAGFIGSNLVHHLLAADAGVRIVGLDKLTYAGDRAHLRGADPARFELVVGDICDAPLVRDLLSDRGVDTVVHLAAESHVDRSIDGPTPFVRTNVVGTSVLLEEARRLWAGRGDVRFHHVSTDEVYGSLGRDGAFSERDRYDPSSPYSATKAAADHLVRAWGRTYGLPVTITNCSNNYGPRQHPEKLIPMMVGRALRGEPLPVYGDGQNVRDWLHVEDHCRAIDAVVRRGEPGATYHAGGRAERTNLELVRQLCGLLDELAPRDTPHADAIRLVADRPGHDRRYAMDTSRIERDLGWTPRWSLDAGLRQTVEWLVAHPPADGASLRRRGLAPAG